MQACLKRYRHILHTKVDEEDYQKRLKCVSSEEEHKVESSMFEESIFLVILLRILLRGGKT